MAARGHKIHSSNFKALHLVFHVHVLRRTHKDDGDIAGAFVLLQSSADLQPAHAGYREAKQDQIRRVGQCRLEGNGRPVGLPDPMALLAEDFGRPRI